MSSSPFNRWIDGLRGDLHFARRYFSRNKVTVAIIVSVFALGIGANTALVTTIQSQMLRPAPIIDVDDAVVLLRVEQRATPTSAWRPRGFSNAEIATLASNTETFAAVNGWLAHDVVINAADSIGARGVRAHFVTPGYFPALGVGIAAGTGFAKPGDGEADLSAVMAWEWAERLYGTPTTAVGQRIMVNEVPVHVVGVAPPAFQGALRQMDRPALFMPVSARAEIARVPARWLLDEPSMEAFARLAPNVERDRATAVARLVVTRSLPDSAERVGMTRAVDAYSMHALLPESYELKPMFAALAAVGLLLLLVTCTNVSSLMVAAAVARRQEIAVRLSLGASRGRILRQLVTEATLLAVAGGSAGLLVCWWMLWLLAGPGGTVDGNRALPDALTLAYTMLVAIGTGVIFGLSPALHATRAGVATALRDSSAGATRQSRLQRGFVVAQIVFSLPLLVMLGASLSMVLADYKPLRPEVSQHVARITFRPLNRTGAPSQRREAVDSLVPRLAMHPEVVSVVPDASWHMVRRFLAPVPGDGGSIDTSFATLRVFGAAPGWMAVQDIPLLLGRDVTLADTVGRPWPVVIGSQLARSLWGNAHPIGRMLASPGDRDTVDMVVVGVYDASRATTAGLDSMNVFSAHGKEWRREALLVRTRGDAEAFLPTLRRMVRELAPGLPVSRLLTLAHADESQRVETITGAALVGAGGALALLLASLGLYGVIALAVRQRTREIGIRIALGAMPTRVARMFLASGVRLGVIALVIGLPLSMIALKLLLTQTGLIAPSVDIWMVGAGVALVLLLVAAGATWLPARRAALVDPAHTLRVE
ncbi:MAG TPA: FtsX-like permease family protein [Gemmatimonadaceae bacterium]|nr:FtsX-like permease family protein [Gemmatimonadaceae bacterium]